MQCNIALLLAASVGHLYKQTACSCISFFIGRVAVLLEELLQPCENQTVG
jgi:hypothetical protein